MQTPEIAEAIRRLHRQRRFAMKLQQKIDRSTESFVRLNFTAWSPDTEDAEGFRKEVKRLIGAARKGDADSGDADDRRLWAIVAAADQSRKPADALRSDMEKQMATLAKGLAVYPWVDGVRGAGALGLATIIGEAGDLSAFPNVGKLWKYLGYAPYGGHAGSTWRRDSWRPHSLTSAEWVDVKFKPERYAMLYSVGVSLFRAQWRKDADGVGGPVGPYGEAYAARRARTAETHPDWSKGHAHSDALRVMMKRFLADMWGEWGRANYSVEPSIGCPPPPHRREKDIRMFIPNLRVNRPGPYRRITCRWLGWLPGRWIEKD